jgi:hypothetical protein
VRGGRADAVRFSDVVGFEVRHVRPA